MTSSNTESIWDQEFQFEHKSQPIKIFSDSCCHGCECQTSTDHIKEN